jgi:transcriptional regulator with XRE-family HTH domain
MGISVLGKIIKDRRKELGITQPHLAELANVSKNTLYKLERGESNPSWEVIRNILDVLGLELNVNIRTIDYETSENI